MTRSLTETTVVEGSRKCTRCGRAKPLGQFAVFERSGRIASWCRQCKRHSDTGRGERSTDEARERRRQSNRRYRESHRDEIRELKRAWRATPVGRLQNYLGVVRYWLKRRPTDALRETEAILIADIERLRGDS